MEIRTIADVERIEERPLKEYISARSTLEFILEGARACWDKPAIHFFATAAEYDRPIAVTYRQLVARVYQTANMLHDAGCGPTDPVSILLPNLPQTHFAIWGAETTGIANPINPLLGVKTISEIMNSARSKALIALGPMPESDLWEKAQQARRQVPTLKAVFQVLGPGDEKDGVYSYDSIVGRYRADSLDSRRKIAPDDIAAYFHTGGTTGTPKLAEHTHLNEIYDAWATSVMGGIAPGDTLLCGLPLFHVNAVIITGLVPFSQGSTVVLLTPAGYRAPGLLANFYKIVERYKATYFSAVPSVFAGLLRTPAGDADVSSLRYAICGAAPMPKAVFEGFEARTGLKILEGYGLTEGVCVSAANPKDGERRIGSIGFRLPFQEMKTVILEPPGRIARDCRPDEIGVVAIRGPNVFRGYVRESDNAGIWLEDGWLNTGDLARQDRDGYFWITGRAKDLIIRGGHNIDPVKIEEVLQQHPAVMLAAAIGKPGPMAGEIPVAYVALKPGQSARPEELVAWCRDRLDEKAAVPREAHILPELPLTAIGKVFKPPLRHMAIAEAYREALGGLEHPELTAVAETDPIHGTIVTVSLAVADEDRPRLEAEVRRILSRFSVHYQICWIDK